MALAAERRGGPAAAGPRQPRPGPAPPYKQVGLVDPATFEPCATPRPGSGCTDFFGYADTANFHEGQWDVRDQFTDVEAMGANVTIDWRLPAFTLTSVTAYEENESRVHEDPDASPNYVMTGNYHGEPRQTSQEFRLTSPEAQLSWIAGAYYFHETNDTSVGFPIPGFGPGALSGMTDVLEGLGQISSMETDSYALFGNVDFAATDRIKLTLGLRYTHETKDVDYAAWLADVTDVTNATFSPTGRSPTGLSSRRSTSGKEVMGRRFWSRVARVLVHRRRARLRDDFPGLQQRQLQRRRALRSGGGRAGGPRDVVEL
ncbi:MAG: TonB-dependent receptor [Proteobacteria bacterium]|nr:TonB-dependent receptor [Pseudomonadota bacterium]